MIDRSDSNPGKFQAVRHILVNEPRKPSQSLNPSGAFVPFVKFSWSVPDKLC